MFGIKTRHEYFKVDVVLYRQLVEFKQKKEQVNSQGKYEQCYKTWRIMS